MRRINIILIIILIITCKKNDNKEVVNNIIQEKIKDIQILNEEPKIEDSIFYYYRTFNPYCFYINKLNLYDLKSENIFKKEGNLNYFGHKDNINIFISENNILYEFNLENYSLTNILEIEEGSFFDDVYYKSDKLIYTTYKAGLKNDMADFKGSIFIKNINDNKIIELLTKNPLDLYSRFNILGYDEKKEILYASEIGGDGGDVWGTMYKIDSDKFNDLNKSIVKLDKDKIFILFGSKNKYSNEIFYLKHLNPQINEGSPYLDPIIAEKSDIYIYDLSNNVSKLLYSPDVKKNQNNDKFNNFIYQIEIEKNNLLFTTPEGIFSLNKNPLKRETVLELPLNIYPVSEYNKNDTPDRKDLIILKDKFIIYQIDMNDYIFIIYNRLTKKHYKYEINNLINFIK